MNVPNAREAFEGTDGIEVKSALPRWICLRIAPQVELKQPVVQFFQSQMISLPEELRDNLATAIDELLSNAMEHGCKLAPHYACEINYIRTPHMIMVQIRDAGPGFSLNSVPHAAVNNPPDNPLRHADFRSNLGMRPGGFGILLVKQIADELIYNESGNEVTLVKYL